MAELSQVTPPAPDPKAGKPRVKSEVAFPYFGLEKSIDVARRIHDRAGGRCTREQLAPLLGYSGVKNGGFLTRISAAKMFGFIDEIGDAIILTDRAKKILAPVVAADADQAKLDAFMAVELYRRVFQDFNGQVLPAAVGLKNKFLNDYKVVPLQVDAALRNLMDSAEAAGLFRVAGTKDRMIKPLIGRLSEETERGSEDAPLPPPQPSPPDTGGKRGRSSDGGSGGGDDGSGIHPALLGLLRDLPPVGSKLPPKRRAALTEAFKSTVNFIWPEDDEQ